MKDLGFLKTSLIQKKYLFFFEIINDPNSIADTSKSIESADKVWNYKIVQNPKANPVYKEFETAILRRSIFFSENIKFCTFSGIFRHSYCTKRERLIFCMVWSFCNKFLCQKKVKYIFQSLSINFLKTTHLLFNL